MYKYTGTLNANKYTRSSRQSHYVNYAVRLGKRIVYCVKSINERINYALESFPILFNLTIL